MSSPVALRVRPGALAPLSLLVCVLAACRAGDEGTVSAVTPTDPPPAIVPAPPPPLAPRSSPSPSAPLAAPPAAPRVENVATVVEYLLARVSGSGLVFIRNGREHTSAEAAKHIRGKYEHFKDEIETPEDFIDKAATKSLLSGKPYLVKMPDGTTRQAADWLRELLAEYRAEQAAPA